MAIKIWAAILKHVNNESWNFPLNSSKRCTKLIWNRNYFLKKKLLIYWFYKYCTVLFLACQFSICQHWEIGINANAILNKNWVIHTTVVRPIIIGEVREAKSNQHIENNYK